MNDDKKIKHHKALTVLFNHVGTKGGTFNFSAIAEACNVGNSFGTMCQALGLVEKIGPQKFISKVAGKINPDKINTIVEVMSDRAVMGSRVTDPNVKQAKDELIGLGIIRNDGAVYSPLKKQDKAKSKAKLKNLDTLTDKAVASILREVVKESVKRHLSLTVTI